MGGPPWPPLLPEAKCFDGRRAATETAHTGGSLLSVHTSISGDKEPHGPLTSGSNINNQSDHINQP